MPSQKHCERGFWGGDAAKLYVRLLGADGNMYGLTRGLEGEALVEEYSFIYNVTNVPNAVRPLITNVVLPAQGEQRKKALFEMTRSGGISTRELWEGCADLEDYKASAAALFADLDAVILPTVALPALRHGSSAELVQAFGYTFFANLLGTPAASIPAGRVRADEVTYKSEHVDSFSAKAQEQLNGAEGLPVSVQVMGGLDNDEVVVGVAKLVESVVAERIAKEGQPLPRADVGIE